MEQFLDKMNNTTKLNEQVPPVTNQGERSEGVPPNEALTKDDVFKLLEAERQKAREEANVELTVSELSKRFGNDYPKVVAEKMKELGLGKEWMEQLARNQPQALLNIIGGAKAPAPVQDRLFTSTVVPQTTANSTQNWKYFEEIRKKEPGRYWSPQVQNELHRQAQRLGEAFYS